MIERFVEREELLDALRSQKLVCGNASLAEEIAAAGSIRWLPFSLPRSDLQL